MLLKHWITYVTPQKFLYVENNFTSFQKHHLLQPSYNKSCDGTLSDWKGLKT